MQIDITPPSDSNDPVFRNYRFMVEPFPDDSGALLIQSYGNEHTRRSLILSTADEQALLCYLQGKYQSVEGGQG